MKINSKKILIELKNRKWTQKKLAEVVKITPQAISILLKRKRAKLSTINKLGKAFNLDPKDLLI